jgi:hypothetical protein
LGVRSPLLTQSQLISFPLPTKMFQFGRFLLTNVSKWDVPFGNLRIKGSLRLHGVISRLGTTFISSRAEQSTKWRSTGSICVQVAYASTERLFNGNDHRQLLHQGMMLCLRSNRLIISLKLAGGYEYFVLWKIEMDRMGFEPMASCLQSRRSSTDLPAHIAETGPMAIS